MWGKKISRKMLAEVLEQQRRREEQKIAKMSKMQ
jgi:hypothetical protein